MTPYPEYIATSLPWLPQIPAHWDWLMLSQLTEEQCVKNIGCQEKNVLSLSYGNIIRKKNIYSGLSPQDFATYQIVFPDNIILRLTDLQNDHRSLRTGLAKEKGIITSAYTCLKVYSNASFVHYLLHAYDLRKVFYGMGGGVRQSIGFKDIRSLRFPVAPASEQEQIVRYLDSMTAKINKLIRAKKKQIALLQEQKQAIINQAVTKGLNPNAEMKDSGIDWLGQIPAHWDVKPLKRVCKVNASVSHLLREFSDDSLVTFLPMEAISVDGKIDCSQKQPLKNVKSGFSSFAVNDVVVAKITPCFENGKGACLDALDTAIGYGTTELIVLRGFKNEINQQFLYQVTKITSFRKNGAEVMTGSAGQKRVPANFIANFTCGIPPLEEQNAIVQYLAKQNALFEKTLNGIKKEIEVILEYKNSLIASVVTGQVDVRNIQVEDFDPADLISETDDNPAEEESTEESEE